MTAGTNSTPDTNQEIEHRLTTANDKKELTHVSVHTWTKNDTLDFYVKASANVSLDKAIWKIRRYDT